MIVPLVSLLVSCSGRAESRAVVEPKPIEVVKPLGPLNSTKKFSTLNVLPYQSSETDKYQEIILKILNTKSIEPESQQKILAGLSKIASSYKINPIFLLAIADVTSHFNPEFQKDDRLGFIPLSPAKASYIAKLYQLSFADPAVLKNIENNLELVGGYFGFVAELYPNNYEHFLLAYNWNAEALSLFLKNRSSLPKLHQDFLNQVTKAYDSYFIEKPAKITSPVVEEKSASTNVVPVKEEVKPMEKEAKQQDAPSTPVASNDPILQINSEKPLPEYYLTTKNKKTNNEYYQSLLSISLAEKLDSANHQQVLKVIVEESLKATIDPVFVFSFIKNSSNFDANQKINGKYGLMQIGEDDAKLAAQLIGQNWLGKDSLINPEVNLSLGLAYLKICHNIFDNNAFQSIAGYRWGIKNLIFALKNKTDIPPLVIRYPQKVLEDYQRFNTKPQKLNDSSTAVAEKRQNITLELNPVQKLVCENTKDLDLCTKLTNLIKKEAENYQVSPIGLAKYAFLQSKFNVDLQAGGKFGLFQWSSAEAEKISEYAKVAWAGPKELLKPEYSVRIAAKYYSYLEQRFKGNKKYVALGLFGDVEQITRALNSKGTIPNDVNSKATQFLQ